MEITKIIERFPADSMFYTVVNGKTQSWPQEHRVYGYRVLNDTVYLLESDETGFAEEYDITCCYKTADEAREHIKPRAVDFQTIAVDANGRQIDFAIFDDETTIEVISDYKVHVEHCCAIHGCKYGDDNCPVAAGKLLQAFLCYDCYEDLRELGVSDISKADVATKWSQIKNKMKELKLK